MHKLILVIVLLVSINTYAKEPLSYAQVDSLTYGYYLSGDWNKLITVGKQAIKDGVDFKYLRQRMGYAYYLKSDFYNSEYQYNKSLEFDSQDLDSKAFVYLSAYYNVDFIKSRYYASQFPDALKAIYKVKPFILVDAVDVEYNYKSNNNVLRSNPNYGRIGLSTKLGYQLSLYQAFSTYSQTLDSTYTDDIYLEEENYLYRSRIKQNEYHVQLEWKPLENFDFLLAYHSINTNSRDSLSYTVISQPRTSELYVDSTYYGNMILGKVSYNYKRFETSLSGSLLNFNKTLTQQYTLKAGVTLPGKYNFRLRTYIDVLLESDTSRLVFTQTVGFIPIKNVWLEGRVTVGNLKNYADCNGMYVYNSKDPTIFRTGVTAYLSLGNNLSIFGNYTYDKKNYLEYITKYYSQHSISGGIIWKI